MEQSANFSELVNNVFADYQQEANVRQLASQQTEEEKEQVERTTLPFEQEGLREGVTHLISTVKTRAVNAIKAKGQELLDKAKSKSEELKGQATDKIEELKGQAGDKIEELKGQVSDRVGQATDKIEEFQNKANQLKADAEGRIENVRAKTEQLKQSASDKMNELETKANELKENQVQDETPLEDETVTSESENVLAEEQPASLYGSDGYYQGPSIMKTLKEGDESFAPEEEQELTQTVKSPGTTEPIGQTRSVGDVYDAQREASLQEDTGIEGETPTVQTDTELKNFAGDLEEDASNEGEEIGEVTADVAEGSEALDIDPATAVIGIGIGLGAMLVGNLFESHTNIPAQVSFNVASQLGVY